MTLEEWLAALGSAEPAPGGGAAAAVGAAMAAGLVEMVTNLTAGRPRFAEYEADTVRVRDRAGVLRAEALGLADRDARAFRALLAAYRLPRDDAGRADAIREATVAAAGAPLAVAEVAAEVVLLAGQLPGRSNPTVLSDVAVAASTAAAALESAAVNVEINLSALTGDDRRTSLADRLAVATAQLVPARELVARLRAELAA
jgi:methenyltetrahydrofolate cyclohydrolase